jgi:hypothetical protein
MTIYTGWDVSIGGFDGTATVTSRGIPTDSIDFTSRVRALSVDQSVKRGSIGRTETKVILDNTDGALTPNGGGTYATFDWFAQPLFVLARAGLSDPPALLTGNSINLRAPFTGGPIVSFDFVDDGFDSFVTLVAVDWLTFVGRFSVQTGQTVTDDALDVLETLAGTTTLAEYGSDSQVVTAFSVGSEPFTDLTLTTAQGNFLGDRFETIAAAEGGVVYPAAMSFWINLFGDPAIIYLLTATQRSRLAASQAGTADTLPDFNGTGTVGSTELPMRALELGFNDHELITQAEVGRTGGTSQFSYKDTASQTYGPRSVSLTDLPLTTDADALSHAEELTTRYDTTNFVPSSFEFTGSMIESTANDAALDGVKTLMHKLTYVYGALFKPTTVTWTGAGSTSNTATVTPMRLRLSATPEDWTMRLHTLDAASNMGFILDDTQLGVLDQNRIT